MISSGLSYSKDSAHLFGHTGMKQLDPPVSIVFIWGLSQGCADHRTSLSLLIYNSHVHLHFLFSRYIIAVTSPYQPSSDGFTSCRRMQMLLMRQMNNNQRATSLSSLWRITLLSLVWGKSLAELKSDESQSGLPGGTSPPQSDAHFSRRVLWAQTLTKSR